MLECSGCHPLVPPAPQGGLASLAQPPGHVPRAAGDQAEEDGLETVTVRDPRAMTAQRVGGDLAFGQVGGKGLPDSVDDARFECKHGTSTGSLGWLNAAGSCPVQHNDRWTFLPGHWRSTPSPFGDVTMASNRRCSWPRSDATVPARVGAGAKPNAAAMQSHEIAEIHLLPPELCEEVVPDLKGTDEVEFRSLFDQLLYLPEIDTSLQVRLGILTPDMDRAIAALQDDDHRRVRPSARASGSCSGHG